MKRKQIRSWISNNITTVWFRTKYDITIGNTPYYQLGFQFFNRWIVARYKSTSMIYHVKECDELFSATDWDQYGVAIVNEHICRIKERDWPKTKQLTNDFK